MQKKKQKQKSPIIYKQEQKHQKHQKHQIFKQKHLLNICH